MSYGKEVCKKLKEIRQQIADENNIAFETCECNFEGECKGTCPKCDAELRYIENELCKRKHVGKKIAIAGVSLGVALSMSACVKSGDMPASGKRDPIPSDTTQTDTTNNENDMEPLAGVIAPPFEEEIQIDTTKNEPPLLGDIAPPVEIDTTKYERPLMGVMPAPFDDIE